MLRHGEVGSDFVELHRLDAAASFSPALMTPFWIAL
jgi:hypothetical protein